MSHGQFRILNRILIDNNSFGNIGFSLLIPLHTFFISVTIFFPLLVKYITFKEVRFLRQDTHGLKNLLCY